MKVIDYIKQSDRPIFSFEILPPLKGNSIYKVYDIIDKLAEFDPKFINITSHHSESVYKPQSDGLLRKVSIRRRPGTVAVAAAIKYKYGIIPVPHIICKGFSKEETEYALLDLNFLGIDNLFIVRGDAKSDDLDWSDPDRYNCHALDLQRQINDFNEGRGLDGMRVEGIETKFSYGMACYPEKHFESPTLEEDLAHLKEKVDAGVTSLVTQMFFDNACFYRFIEPVRAKGITVPIHAGIMPITTAKQLGTTVSLSGSSVPKELADMIATYGENKEDMRKAGIDYAVRQILDLKEHGVDGIHIYSMNKLKTTTEICGLIS